MLPGRVRFSAAAAQIAGEFADLAAGLRARFRAKRTHQFLLRGDLFEDALALGACPAHLDSPLVAIELRLLYALDPRLRLD